MEQDIQENQKSNCFDLGVEKLEFPEMRFDDFDLTSL